MVSNSDNIGDISNATAMLKIHIMKPRDTLKPNILNSPIYDHYLNNVREWT